MGLREEIKALRDVFTAPGGYGDGKLIVSELPALVDWVWDSFHPGGTPLEAEQRAALTKTLMARRGGRLLTSHSEHKTPTHNLAI